MTEESPLDESALGGSFHSRRSFIEIAARSLLGVSALPLSNLSLSNLCVGAESSPGRAPSAKQVIYLFMAGGMSHLDTFDLKPGTKVQGETVPIETNVPGIQFGENLPGLARFADKLAIVRSLHTETGDHDAGQYLMLTSYKETVTMRHPCLGAWMQKLLGKKNKNLPDSVIIGGQSRHPSGGFFDSAYAPLPIGDPNAGLQNTKAPAYLTEKSFDRRLQLIDDFDSAFQARYKQKEVQAYNDFYRQAARLLSSEELKGFELSQEPDKKRDEYGRDPFGQGCLLARRLIQNNVRFVEVELGDWDHHSEIQKKFPARAAILDRALGALLADLEGLGMLKETLVVLATEFGRTPQMNANKGRDHHPGVFACALAGGGIRGGQVYGSSDAEGHSPDKDAVRVADFNATIATALGLPLNQEVRSDTGRPFKVAHNGDPLLKLF